MLLGKIWMILSLFMSAGWLNGREEEPEPRGMEDKVLNFAGFKGEDEYG
jgi:hypothetical protein